jgi:hypothetical protein
MEEIICNHEPKHAKGLCRKCYRKQWTQLNKDKIVRQVADYYQKNKERIREQHNTYYQNTKEQKVAYYKTHKVKRLEQMHDWWRRNRDKILDYRANNKYKMNQYQRIKRKIDIQFCIAGRLRCRTRQAIKNKSASTQKLTGCTWKFLVSYLESLFKPGMTWENRSEWHIDHIRPLISFDLTDPEQQKLACHYTNLQPLWAEENLSKGDKYELL